MTPAHVWAVGSMDEGALAEQWNGRSWTEAETPAPDPGTRDVLSAVSGSSATDVWAVGYSQSLSGRGKRPLVEHWDGTRWKKVASPELPPGTSAALSGVDVIAPDEAWAVGGGRFVTLLERWNGHAWKAVGRIRGTQGRQVESTAVTALGSRDVWAVGRYPGGKSTVTMHWDGSSWTRIPSRNDKTMPLNLLYGVSAVASDDVWAVGCSAKQDGNCGRTLVEHWDGSRWRKVAAPSPGATNSGLHSVSVDRADDGWAVGYRSDDSGQTSSRLLLHWDGAQWRRVQP